MSVRTSQAVDTVRCPICDAPEARAYRQKAAAQYYRCKACAALFQHPLPDAEAMKRYAEAQYQAGGYREYVAAREMKLEHFRRRMEVIRPRAGKGRLLDVGCSCGYFLEVAADEGYEVQGIEFSENAIAAARPDIRARIRRAPIDLLCAEDSLPFDVITAFDVIEHLARPLEFLEQSRRMLAKDGLLVVSTPDADHWLAPLMGARWPMLQPMQHLTVCSRRALRLALERTGFEVVAVETAYKVVSGEYLIEQVRTLDPVIHAAFAAVSRLAPRRTMRRYRSVNIGEVLAIGSNRVSAR